MKPTGFNSMWCPHCQHPRSRVIDKQDKGEYILRRRQCLKCRERFSTDEIVRVKLVTKVKSV